MEGVLRRALSCPWHAMLSPCPQSMEHRDLSFCTCVSGTSSAVFRELIEGAGVQVAVCCFDKTGTLTSDNMVLKGLVGLAGRAREIVADAREGSREALRVLAACQSLIQVDGQLVGDPLERAAFQATGALAHTDAFSLALHLG